LRFIQSLVLPALAIMAAAGIYLALPAMPPNSEICTIEHSARVRFVTGPTIEEAITLLGDSLDNIEPADRHEHTR
jgi:hypothetical protein